MKKVVIFSLLMLGLVLAGQAQLPPGVAPPDVNGKPNPGGVMTGKKPQYYPRLNNPIKKKTRKYNRATWKFTYVIYMKDGSELEANSEIFKDPATGKHFLYYTVKDSVLKIFPELTESIARPNPHDLDELIEGQPWGNTWRFRLTEGKISSWSDFQKTKEPQEFQVEGGEVLPVSAPEFEALMKTYEKAWQAWQKKQYYLAITIFNSK